MFKILSTHINPSSTYKTPNGAAKIYRIYKNPQAKDLFIKAKEAKTAEERQKLINEMGEYDIVTEKEKMPSRNRFVQLLKGLFSAFC